MVSRAFLSLVVITLRLLPAAGNQVRASDEIIKTFSASYQTFPLVLPHVLIKARNRNECCSPVAATAVALRRSNV